MRQLRLIGMSSLISVLIWIVADSSMSESETIDVWITPISAGSEAMHVDTVEANDEPFAVVFTGNRTTINDLRRSEPLQVRIPITERDSGVYTLKLDSELAADTNRFANLIIQDVSPPTMKIQVIQDQTITMPIEVIHGSLKYTAVPIVEPSEVSVTLSETDLAKITAENRRIFLDADEHLRTAERDKMLEKVVPLRPVVEGYNVQLDPEYVTLRAQLAAQLREETLAAVPIRIESSMEIFNAFDVEVRNAGAILTQTIAISAPIETIERIGAGEIKVYGVISISAEDKANTEKFFFVTPRFSLPPGATLVGDTEPIELRLTPRAARESESP
ncbi:MAG: hypothetical protein GXP29_11025 [Planctomycetes bacterium]|nr:hypothetical protein [Planctomycetota bacterium]